MSSHLVHLIDLLNAPPFNYTETLISFTTKSSADKIQLLNNIIAHFDTKHTNPNIAATESPDATAARLLDYLSNTVQYRFSSADDAVTLFDVVGDNSEIIYTVLYYILTHQPQITKRTHIAQYMRPVDIPTEFVVDATVQQLITQLHTLQQTWKHQHQVIHTLQPSPPVSQLQHDMTRSNHERLQIHNKIDALKQKIEHGGEYDSHVFSDVLKYTNLIRLQQEEEEQLYNYASDIKYKLDVAEQSKQVLQGQVQQLRQTSQAEPNALVNQLQQVVQQRQRDVQQLDANTKRQSRQLTELHDLVNGTAQLMSEDEVAGLQDYVSSVTQKTQMLQKQIDSIYHSNSDLDLYQKRLRSNGDKRARLTSELSELEREYGELASELGQLRDELSQLNSTSNVTQFKSQGQYDAFTAQLNAKSVEYKRKQAEVTGVSDQVEQYEHVLQVLNNCVLTDDERTAEVQQLYMQARSIQQQHHAEQQMAQQHVDLTSQSAADLKKLYNTVCMQIKHQKSVLQPDVDKLRELRQQFGEWKNTYIEQCNLYKLMQLQYSSDSVKNETQLNGLSGELDGEKKMAAEIKTLADELTDRRAKLDSEVTYESGVSRYSDTYKTYTAYCVGEASALEEQVRVLSNEKQALDGTYDTAVLCTQQFSSLQRLLECKLKVRQHAYRSSGANQYGNGNSQAMVF